MFPWSNYKSSLVEQLQTSKSFIQSSCLTRYQCKLLAFLLHLHKVPPSHNWEVHYYNNYKQSSYWIHLTSLYCSPCPTKLPKIQTHSSRFSLLTKKDRVLITLSRNLQESMGMIGNFAHILNPNIFLTRKFLEYYVLLAMVNNRSPSKILRVALFLTWEKMLHHEITVTKLKIVQIPQPISYSMTWNGS